MNDNSGHNSDEEIPEAIKHVNNANGNGNIMSLSNVASVNVTHVNDEDDVESQKIDANKVQSSLQIMSKPTNLDQTKP